MAVRAVVWRSYYQDSMILMRIAESLRALPGVREAAVLMGTPANHELLAAAGLATPETKAATPGDLVLAVAASTDAEAQAALDAAKGLFDARRREREATGRILPRTLESALRQLPDANLVSISVPGAYAKFEAMRGLRRGLHVFLFSDNVSLADEVELKQVAVRRRLLCMGPDCGTAYLNGVGLGFANVVARGRVGCVAASGTGLQAVASRLAALGEGVSHGIGVGGRDLSAEVDGAMTKLALEALAADPTTEAVILISKPPAASVLPGLEATIRKVGKPIVVSCLGAAARGDGSARWVTTLEDAADAAVALLDGRSWAPRAFSDPVAVRTRLARLRADTTRRGAGLLGLYTGGTLAHEARLLLEPLLGPIASNVGAGGEAGPHRILDLGADEFTVGRLHPMLDPEGRAARVREAGRSAGVGVVLVDLVLGRGVHADPARPLAAAIEDARRAAAADGRSLLVVASVVGTERDPQGLGAQVGALEAAGAEMVPSNAQAARFAALALNPSLEAELLGDAR
ncbi:MAG: acyl-CoA synthetase FdrA [Candidatus Rokubacteria bacterium]|nr:acyl-CoA synthetase FdrA [Candidatus Rokubacteria bacterium]